MQRFYNSNFDNKDKLERSNSYGYGEDSARNQPISPARRDEILRQNLAQSVRSPMGAIRSPVMRSPMSKGKSPLSDEIRKMFQEAIADSGSGDRTRAAGPGNGTTETPVLQRSLSGRMTRQSLRKKTLSPKY